MNSKQKTILTFIILISIGWILLYDRLIVIPIFLTTFSIVNLIKVAKTQKILIQEFDKAESIDNKIEIGLPIIYSDFKIRKTNDTLFFDKNIKNSIPSSILKFDLKNRNVISRNSRKLDFGEIDYFALMITRTIKTNRNIISLSCRTKKDLKELYLLVCPVDLKVNEATIFFESLLRIIGLETNINIKQLGK
ncbi:hypothetical protein EMN47_20405 [Prolixibacteraceae bacterium JC049]|nr:hypothetical protein [Prolixibacteraceae bacterium JC049]